MSLRKDMEQLARDAEEQGWEVRVLKSGHRCWTSPSGAKVFTSSTPSDPRTLMNHRALLRKHGFQTMPLHKKGKK